MGRHQAFVRPTLRRHFTALATQRSSARPRLIRRPPTASPLRFGFPGISSVKTRQSPSCRRTAEMDGRIGGIAMRGKCLGMVVVALFVASSTLLGGDETGKDVLKKLQGTWKFISKEMDGKK